ncbi:hypothetical protein TNCV_1711391 [Trichonephila clavipes]|nr:hypothetical protein TNCV_1711391 [Trichonephila clavipes]
MGELYLDQTPQDINKEFQLERVRIQAFVAATDPACKKELKSSLSSLAQQPLVCLGLLQNIFPSSYPRRWLLPVPYPYGLEITVNGVLPLKT